MENTSAAIETNRRKTALVIVIALAFIIVSLFWTAIQLFHWEGLPLYFLQLGLYLFLFLVALWGLRQDQITLPIDAQRIVEALAWSAVGWLLFLLIIQLLGIAQLPGEFQALKDTPAWRTGAKILSTWFFVGIGEEVLFRGYHLQAFRRHLTRGTSRQQMVTAILFTSAFFSLWHLPNRILWFMTGEINIVLFLISMLILFLLGMGYAYLFVRSDNILLAGLVHGLSDFPLVGMSTQLTPIILLGAIGCVEIARLIAKNKVKAGRNRRETRPI
jgi:membrane protease YdiL (CAAX protease family)